MTNAALHVTISDDGLVAQVRVDRGAVAALTDVRAALTAAGVERGVDEDALTALAERLQEPATGAAIAIAHGIAPVDGTDGCIESRLEKDLQAGRTADDETIDFRERNALRPVTVGDTVAIVRSPTSGTPGHTVRGEPLPPRAGRPDGRHIGEGLERRGDTLVAARDGVVLWTSDLVDVTPLHVHRGDVDYAGGNLHSNGTLIVTGDIVRGFLADASGDVVVHGSVENGQIRAGGAAHVQHGILGDSVVQAGADVACRHATAARITARGDVEIADQAHQARITADTIHVERGRASVRGGELRAQRRIVVGTAGCPSGTTTLLAVGEPVAERVAAARETAKASRLARSARKTGNRGGKTLRAAVRAADRESDARLRVRRQRAVLLAEAEIQVHTACHPGVVIRFGGAELRPDHELGPCTFHFDQESRTIVRRLLP